MELNRKSTATPDQTDCTLSPGELVQDSGIYEVCHYDEERSSVILVRNTIFPYCRRCGERVRYKLLELVPHISEDPDFREDPPPGDPPYEMTVSAPTLPAQLSRSHGFRFTRI